MSYFRRLATVKPIKAEPNNQAAGTGTTAAAAGVSSTDLNL